jgi:hypothetical protein
VNKISYTNRKEIGKNCTTLGLRAFQYKEIILLCEQITRFGIGIQELLAFHAAVMKKIEVENLPYGEALYSLMDSTYTSEKLIDAKKQLNDTWMQIQMVNLFSERQIDALNSLMKLQSCGVTDDEILNIYGFLNGARLESARGIGKRNHFDSYLSGSRNGSNFGAPI